MSRSIYSSQWFFSKRLVSEIVSRFTAPHFHACMGMSPKYIYLRKPPIFVYLYSFTFLHSYYTYWQFIVDLRIYNYNVKYIFGTLKLGYLYQYTHGGN